MNSQFTGAAPKPPLDALVEQFAQWRKTRTDRRSPTPKHLRDSAIHLLKNYRKSHVIKALGINSAILKAWQGHPPATPPKRTFIPVDLVVPLTETSALEFTVVYSQGSEVTIKGSLSPTQLAAVCQGLRPSLEPLEVHS